MALAMTRAQATKEHRNVGVADRDLPHELEPLGELALDLRWTWSHEAPFEVANGIASAARSRTLGQRQIYRREAASPTETRLVDPHRTPNRERTRDLAMFNLAIDSKLRGCDVVSLRDCRGTGLPRGRQACRQGRLAEGPRVRIALPPPEPTVAQLAYVPGNCLDMCRSFRGKEEQGWGTTIWSVSTTLIQPEVGV